MKSLFSSLLTVRALVPLLHLLLAPAAVWSYSSVTAGSWHVCGIDSDGKVQCDTDSHATRLLPPDDLGTFQFVDAGDAHTCGLETTGEVTCWGDNYYDQLDVPAMTLPVVSLSAGRSHNCAVDSGGAISCWGLANNGRLIVPESVIEQASGQRFISVSTTDAYTCAIDSASQPLCWTEMTVLRNIDPPAGLLAQKVEAYIDDQSSYNLACALDLAGEVQCWGMNVDESNRPDFPDAPYVDIAVGREHACAVTQSGELQCIDHFANHTWNLPVEIEQGISGRQVVAVVAGTGYEPNAPWCVTDSDGIAWCWNNFGLSRYLQNTPALLEAPNLVRASIYAADLAELFWGGHGQDGLQIEIYQDDRLLAVTSNENSYMVDGLQPSQDYRFKLRKVQVLDAEVSDFSDEIVVNTDTLFNPVLTYTPPARSEGPANLRADVYWENTVELFWDRQPTGQQTEVLGYEIRRNGTYIGFTDGISYIDRTVQSGDRTLYDVIAVHRTGTMQNFSTIAVTVGEEQCR